MSCRCHRFVVSEFGNFQMYVLLACGFGALHFLLGEGIVIFQFEAFVFFYKV